MSETTATTPTTPAAPAPAPAAVAPKPEAANQPDTGVRSGGGANGPSSAGTYKPAGGAGGANTRHPAHAYSGIADPEGYRAYCANIARHALSGAAGSMEAVGSLKNALKRNDEYAWAAKQRALWIIRRAHRKYAGAERTAAKAAISMATARAKADEVLIESKRKKRNKAGAYVAGGRR